MHYDIAKSLLLAAVTAVLVAAGPGSNATAAVELAYTNGVVATLHGADELSARLKSYQGSPSIELSDGRLIPVITDINDPSIYNHGDGEFHPFTRALVDHALASMTHPNMPLEVRIYLLPYPRRGAMVSSTAGNEIFLSPHVLEIEPAVASYIIAHELGHVFHNRFMPSGSSRWREYRELRGITDERQFNDGAAHAYRPREIFAEDFRVLFGGPDAIFGSHVENTQIAEPGAVPGLAAFILRMASERTAEPRIAATSSPNPFNPETEIRIVVPPDDGGVRVSVRVYSVTGALVRDLYDGSPSGDVAVRWDGRDNRGNRVVSAAYFAQIRMGNESETLKLVLLK